MLRLARKAVGTPEAYLRRVRRGEALTILYRDLPIARVIPWLEGPPPLSSRPPLRRLHSVVLPPPVRAVAESPTIDSAGALRDERSLLEAVELVALGPAILRRACDPFPTPLSTRDALAAGACGLVVLS